MSERILVDYSEARDTIRDADLLLFRRRNCIARLIEVAGRSPYVHAAMAAWWKDRLMCVEMTSGGGRAQLLSNVVERWPGVIDVYQANAIGPLMVVKYALPLLRKGNKKLIVNFSSEAGSIGACGRTREYSYCMSKAALNMASRILQNALKEEDIKVLALHPGWFSSDMGGAEAPITPSEAAEEIVKLILNPPGLDEPIFVDSNGETFEW